MNCLITGMPGVGKTELIKKLARELAEFKPSGFYTAEIREEGQRVGFELVGLNGIKNLFSHVNIDSSFKVGRYGVDIAIFDEFLEKANIFEEKNGPVIIDEIGKMECFSQKFRKIIWKLLDMDRLVVATISSKGSGFRSKILDRNDILICEVTRFNRDYLLSDILSAIAEKQ